MRPDPERHLTKAKEEIYDAVRFLSPYEAERVLRELADQMKGVANRYDNLLMEAILS